MELDVSGSESGEDRFIASSQSSLPGSYCHAPPNATIIDSCNSGELSSSDNTVLIYMSDRVNILFPIQF